jgi:predicted molibdopterin-dependent oxidoreductase YjgC
MSAERLVGDVERGPAVTIIVDGRPVTAYRGESVAAALLADGRRALRRTLKERAPRGMFCGMGVCFDCLVSIDGRADLRACLIAVEDGMTISTGLGADDDAGH